MVFIWIWTDVIRTMSRCFGALRQLRTIRQSVPTDTFQGLVVSHWFHLVTLAGLRAYLLNQLQATMNAEARLIFNVNRREHITPLLRQLHWLPGSGIGLLLNWRH